MQYNININQKQAMELWIRNINQAVIFDTLTKASTWCDEIVIDSKVFYWVSRTKIIEEHPILDIKSDTAYRHLKALADLELIEYVKSWKKDCVRITEKGKSYISDAYVGNKSEKEENSETDPNKSGNKSENNSETDPTYHNTNNITIQIDTSKREKFNEQDIYIAKAFIQKQSTYHQVMSELKKDPEGYIKKQADEVRKLREIDWLSHQDIIEMLKWILNHRDWTFSWKDQIMTIWKLRQTHKSSGAKYFDYFKDKMENATGGCVHL